MALLRLFPDAHTARGSSSYLVGLRCVDRSGKLRPLTEKLVAGVRRWLVAGYTRDIN